MPYPSAQLVLRAVEGLQGRPPLAVVTIPALLKAAVQQSADPTAATGVIFGSTNERELLEHYFQLPRPPRSDRPFKAMWDTDGTLWVDRNYPGRTLQRTRRDRAQRGVVLQQIPGSGATDRWRLLPAAGSQLRDEWSESHDPESSRVRLIDLALLFGREREFSDLNAVLDWFKAEFAPDQGDVIGTIFEDGVPAEYLAYPLVPERMDAGDYEELGSLPPALTFDGSLDDLVAALEARITLTRFELPDGLVRRVMSAWLRGDIVVLVGQPGTGKTRFATALADAMETELGLSKALLIPIRADFDEAEFLGYERLDGTPQLREFAARVLQTEKPLEPQVVILEEYNLVTVEAYLASVLVATQETSRAVTLPGGGAATLPVDTFIIATCNSYLDEPETRARVSAPAKRRSTMISMPNVLAKRIDDLPQGVDDPAFGDTLVALATAMIETEADRVAARFAVDQASTFDGIRRSALTAAPATLFANATRERLALIGKAILSNAEGRSWFTLGLLRDVALGIAVAGAEEGAQLEAIVQSVADKLVHQLRGPHANADALVAAVDGLPGSEVVRDLTERMKAGGALDELIPLI